jgi:hypothetical protein
MTALGLITQEGEHRAGVHRADQPRVDLHKAGQVPRRVAALLAPRPRLRLLLLAAAIVLVAISGAAALEAARNFHQLIELAQGQHA